MTFCEALKMARANTDKCMFRADKLRAVIYWEKALYFLMAYPDKEGWYQYTPCPDDLIYDDWELICKPVKWANDPAVHGL